MMDDNLLFFNNNIIQVYCVTIDCYKLNNNYFYYLMFFSFNALWRDKYLNVRVLKL